MTGPAVIGYDGSAAAKRAISEVSGVLATRSVVVVSVWEPGLAFDLIHPDIIPAAIDIRTAMEVDEAMYERAQKLAAEGASLAQQAGFGAEGLAVADEGTVADTLLRIAKERSASAVVAGTHGHRGLRALLGSTS
ncbi:MAG: hypothetical protein QOF97_1439, partial [Acidimicrobiaceae bacterium]